MNKNLLNTEHEYGIYLKPGEPISKEFLEDLKNINAKYTKSGNFQNYQRSILKLFKLRPVKITEKTRIYLAGFIEGEGSVNIGAKKNQSSSFKVYLDPEFNVTQHINGFSNLYLAMCYFQTGRVRYKSGSKATMVYTIDNRQNLKEKVLPFYEKYIIPFGSPIKTKRFQIYKELLRLFDEKAHLDLNRMLYEVLPLWDTLRIQVDQKNQTFKSLSDAQEYVKRASEKNKKEK